MTYLTREDGERFIVPSYREVLSVQRKGLLKKQILLLSQNYGEYITLQHKAPTQYEVAFSPDTGYLLGESVWNHFKRPPDMIYAEVIPNTSEAILVIVKAGSVYLDGKFPIDSLPDELVIFKTQQNNFEVYIYGDLPIVEHPVDGKFNVDASSLKSFTVLDAPVFPTLALVKAFRLRLVDTVLKSHGIGVFPVKQFLAVMVVGALLWMGYSYMTAHRPVPEAAPPNINPYQGYFALLASPAPDKELAELVEKIKQLFTIPGWAPAQITYKDGTLEASVKSAGSKTENLVLWTENNGAQFEIKPDGFYVHKDLILPKRPIPTKIYPLKEAIVEFVDRLSTILPGNRLQVAQITNKGVYNDTTITINFDSVSLTVLSLISQQFEGLPFALKKVALTVTNGSMTGSINLEAMGT